MVRFPYSLKYKERPLAFAVRYLNLRGQSVTFPGSALKPSGRRTVRSIHVEKAIGNSNPTNP